MSIAIAIMMLPLLMSDAGSPYLYPDSYFNYTIENTSAEVRSETGSYFFYFSGQITNTGDGIIDFINSSIKFRPINYTGYYQYLDTYSTIKSDASMERSPYLFPNETCTYSLSAYANNFSTAADISQIDYIVNIRAYSSPASDVSYEYKNFSIVSYDEAKDTTQANITYEIVNNSKSSIGSALISYKADGVIYRTYYEGCYCSKNSKTINTSRITAHGDLRTKTISDVSICFFPYVSYYSGFKFSWIWIPITIFAVLFIIMIPAIGIIVAVTIVHSNKAKKERENKEEKK
jgi:hypothetical protein